jgi:hypothetical protein
LLLQTGPTDQGGTPRASWSSDSIPGTQSILRYGPPIHITVNPASCNEAPAQANAFL